MSLLTLSDIKTKGSSVISDDHVSVLVVNSKPKTALVPWEDYEALIETLEDYEDLLSVAEREGEETVSFDEFRKELDLV